MEPFIHTYLYLSHVRTRPRSQEWASVCLTTNVSTSSIYLIINVRGDVVFTMAAQCIITIMRYNCRHDPSVLARGAQCPLRCNNILTGQVQVPSNIKLLQPNFTSYHHPRMSIGPWGTFTHELMYNVVCHESKISSLLPASYHQTISVVLPAAGASIPPANYWDA